LDAEERIFVDELEFVVLLGIINDILDVFDGRSKTLLDN
jgi:hypothetical protein